MITPLSDRFLPGSSPSRHRAFLGCLCGSTGSFLFHSKGHSAFHPNIAPMRAFCSIKHPPHPHIPNTTEMITGNDAFKLKTTIKRRTAVAGNPHSTPFANWLKCFKDSPCTLSHNKLSRLTSGKAAIIPPISGDFRAISVIMAINIADTPIFTIKNMILPPGLTRKMPF